MQRPRLRCMSAVRMRCKLTPRMMRGPVGGIMMWRHGYRRQKRRGRWLIWWSLNGSGRPMPRRCRIQLPLVVSPPTSFACFGRPLPPPLALAAPLPPPRRCQILPHRCWTQSPLAMSPPVSFARSGHLQCCRAERRGWWRRRGRQGRWRQPPPSTDSGSWEVWVEVELGPALIWFPHDLVCSVDGGH